MANTGETYLPYPTYLVKGQGLPEHPDRVIDSHKGERFTTKDPDARNGIPTTQGRRSYSKLGGSKDGGYEPHAEELYGHLTTERLFETRCQLLALGV